MKNGIIGACLLIGILLRGAAWASTAPDLEGTWTNASLTRLERPAEYGNRGVLTAREVNELEKKNSDLVALGNKPTDPKATVKELPADCSGGRGGNWHHKPARTQPRTPAERGHSEPRTSLTS